MTTTTHRVPATVQPVNPAAYAVARVLLGLIFNAYIRTTVSGREHLPAPGTPILVTANHTSSLDVFAAGYALGRSGHFLGKVEALEIPLFGAFLKACGAIPAQRDGRDTQAVRQIIACLEAGELVGIAPEGTRSPDGRLQAFDPGFVWLALRTGATVVPCAIHGATDLMPKGAQYPRPGRLWVRFGAPMTFTDEGTHPNKERLEALAADVRSRTLALLRDLAAESGRPNPAVTAGE